MKKHSVLVLSLLTAIVGCGSSDGSPPAGTAGSGGFAGAPVGTAGSGGMSALAGSAGAPTATAGSAGAAAAAGSGGTCDIAPLAIFQRSDTEASWDDNDFSEVTLSPAPACPVLVDVTWPHEMGWQNADPSEANFEATHFTLDSSTTVDLTNKKLSLTIELGTDVRGPAATAGSYSISLVSVSTFDRVVMTGGAGTNAGGASGSGGSAGAAGGSSGASVGGASGSAGAIGGSGGTSGGGGDNSAGTAGAAVTTETGYSEAESPVAERVTLRYAGDRATVNFALPAKTSAVDSYDPTRVIKINIRIYSVFSNGMTMGMGGAGGMTGTAGTGGTSGSSGSAGAALAGNAGTVGLGGGGGASGASASGGGGTGGGSAVVPVYDYKTSQFKITNFVIKDVSAP